MMTNNYHTVLYTGVTNNLIRRVWEHKQGLSDGFTKKYLVKKLVYYEFHERMEEAITREKQIKAGSRKKKEELVEKLNPGWEDLYSGLLA